MDAGDRSAMAILLRTPGPCRLTRNDRHRSVDTLVSLHHARLFHSTTQARLNRCDHASRGP